MPFSFIDFSLIKAYQVQLDACVCVCLSIASWQKSMPKQNEIHFHIQIFIYKPNAIYASNRKPEKGQKYLYKIWLPWRRHQAKTYYYYKFSY